MTTWRETKYRDDDTWGQVRRAWEAGETAASVARRYDVGVDNLWRRRAKEGWERRKGDDRPPEPVEGWDRYAEKRLARFEGEIADARTLAQDLLNAMQGGRMDGSLLWHLGFLYAFRAEHLGPEVAAADRARAEEKEQPWVEAFWDAEGRLRPVHVLDQETLRLYRETWRKQVGLPDGVAEDVPCWKAG